MFESGGTLARALVVAVCCCLLVACADAPATRSTKATAPAASSREAVKYPAIECVACTPLARAQLAAKTPTASGFVFVYDPAAERIYKYEISPELGVREMVPVDKAVRMAFDTFVASNRENPDLVRSGRSHIVMPETLQDPSDQP